MWGALGSVGGLVYRQTPPAVVPLYFNGLYAYAHFTHPPIVHQLVAAANELVDKPYKLGGGHRFLFDNGFDCSGSISHVLYRAKLLNQPLSSSAFANYAWANGIDKIYPGGNDNPDHDMFVPTMGGLELRQVLQDTAPGVATILVTGQPDKVEDLVDDDIDFQTGRVAMLYKPVHPVMLLAEVDKRLMKVVGMR